MRIATIASAVGWVLLWAAAVAQSEAASVNVVIDVTDKATGYAVACRIHLLDKAGTPQQAGALPFWRDHVVCPGVAVFNLAPGDYTYEIERGPEYGLRTGALTVKDQSPTKIPVVLARLVDLKSEGWWSGELHVHRPLADIKLLMRAEDLHVAPVITWWQALDRNRTEWDNGNRVPDNPLIQFDQNRYYDVMAGEDEREGGAILYFNLREPLDFTGTSPEFPSPLKFVAEARRHKNVWIDIEKPFWWDVPVWLASGQVDSIGLANNHMNRSQMSEKEAWGKPAIRN